jgi:hypothetical protein
MTFQRNVKVVGFALGILLVLVIMPCTAPAVPQEIHYQGYLTDAEGSPLNGTLAITFRIWDEPGGGMQLWSESHAAVTLTEGVFNLILGSSVPITSEILDGDCYLGVTVGEDDEMVPRQPLTATPFALKAAHADDADTLDGLDSLDFASVFHSHSFSGAYASVSGGWGNEAIGLGSSLCGGRENKAEGDHASVSGGSFNTANGPVAHVSGGRDNIATGWYSVVSGGASRSALGTDNWRAGGYSQDN